MSILKVTCQTASTTLKGVEIKPSQVLLESSIHIEPNKMPSPAYIELIKEQFSTIATTLGLPDGEICTCTAEIT